MALVVYWYDFICFGIIAGAIFGSLWVLRQREAAGKLDGGTKYESLLVDRTDGDDLVGHTPSGHLGSTQLWMTCWSGVHPIWLLATRGASCIVLVGFLAWDILRYDTSIFVYYTEWTFTLVIVYFALGTVISAHGCWMYSNHLMENEESGGFLKTDSESKSTTATFRTNKIRGTIKVQSRHQQEEIERRAGFWGYLMQSIYQTCAGAAMLTDIVFWGLIVPFLSIEHFSLNMLMGCMHVLNALFLLLDTALNSMPFPWFRLAYFVLWSCLYVIFQWVLHACGFTWWPYPFLELSTPWAPLWYFCLALVHIPCYGFYAIIVKLKNSTFPRLFPHAYIKSY
ncbi:uncharacterized protein LOC131231229 isoform X1 [Magnolia sinica]|uniref:uncharacterized protein LOC131231229 isoform X1 n=1 Tax=Magnolia sinica TaxID=86752 RepID=UPI00265B40C6|nr:uncharacterized protein LOC131231229 isoform X1 [Magnolia sinica]